MTLRTVQVPDPPPGVDWTYTVPGDRNITLLGALATLTTDAPGPPPPRPCAFTPANVHTSAAFATVFGPPTGYLTVPLTGFNPGNGPWSLECVVRGIQNTSADGIVYAAEPPPGGVALANLRVAVSATFGGLIDWSDGAAFQTAFGNKPCDIDDWVHLAVTSGGSGAGNRLKVYWSGNLDTNVLAGVYALTAPARSVIGSNVTPLGGNSFFWLSDWAAYHTELSAARVAAHAAAMLTDLATLAADIMADSPRVYYQMADAFGSGTAADSSGNAFNGTVNGTVVFGEPGVTNPPAPPPPPFPARAANLLATSGNDVIGTFPPPQVQSDSRTVVYAWLPNLGAPSSVPTSGTETVAIPPLSLPPGYEVATGTTFLDAGDQWSNITLWYDDTPSAGGLGPVDYLDRLVIG